MKVEKTDSGRDAMRERDDRLSVRLRQLMVLANGEREVEELMLLSAASLQDVGNLMSWGFLVKVESGVTRRDEVPAPPTRGRNIGPVRSTSPSTNDASRTRRSQTGEHRRSLAGAKLYMLGILEISRHASAMELRRMLLGCSDATGLVDALTQCINELRSHASEGYANRVAAQVNELLPIEHLGRWRTGSVTESA